MRRLKTLLILSFACVAVLVIAMFSVGIVVPARGNGLGPVGELERQRLLDSSIPDYSTETKVLLDKIWSRYAGYPRDVSFEYFGNRLMVSNLQLENFTYSSPAEFNPAYVFHAKKITVTPLSPVTVKWSLESVRIAQIQDGKLLLEATIPSLELVLHVPLAPSVN